MTQIDWCRFLQTDNGCKLTTLNLMAEQWRFVDKQQRGYNALSSFAERSVSIFFFFFFLAQAHLKKRWLSKETLLIGIFLSFTFSSHFFLLPPVVIVSSSYAACSSPLFAPLYLSHSTPAASVAGPATDFSFLLKWIFLVRHAHSDRYPNSFRRRVRWFGLATWISYSFVNILNI